MPSLDKLLEDLTGGDEPRAENAAVQFASKGKPAFEALKHLADHEEAEYRWWALRALSEFDHPGVKPVLVAGLHDPELEVQTCAALALRHHPSEAAIPSLVALLGHPESLLSRVAGDALAAVGKAATAPMIELLDEHSGDPHLAKVEAVRVLAEIGDPAAIPTLFHIFQEGSSMMQYWAEKGLEKMGIGMVFFNPH